MFGLVTASVKELGAEEQRRYSAVYCGICRAIRVRHSQAARLALSYDMAFLALLLTSMYEPEEISGGRACALHPMKPRPWAGSDAIDYAADMNVALAYYKALDDWKDDGSAKGKLMAKAFRRHMAAIEEQYPRQCEAIRSCIEALSALEKENCPSPDAGANRFGELMGELFAWREDYWSPHMRLLGHYLGRFIYLADAAVDYRRDAKKGKYNPFLAMGGGEDFEKWEQYLVLAMAGCTKVYEMLPLVREKRILDNILYSGVWVNYRRAQKESRKEKEHV